LHAETHALLRDSPGFYPTLVIPWPNQAMPSDATSFTFLLGLAHSLLAQVTGRDGLDDRPGSLRPAVMRRLESGVRVLASFVRRLLVLMALSLEHGLVDRVDASQPLPRPKGRRRTSGARFKVLPPPFSGPYVVGDAIESWRDRVGTTVPVRQAKPVSPARLYRLLDQLAAIVADPEPRARRLAFHLARRRDGPILPPVGPARIAGIWGMEVRASHDAMAGAILSASRVRPPPLPPPRRAGPTVTGL
jgi:hypothetical protein